ncbi:RNA polymerase sigma factor [Streptomyces tirandamycinicus]|uniref:RNA polymerase sigma factor 70 region 4 type 2 domain-containing protein n=1 Tax=Streptomyces tirandamycinicus TaxID=2174846 RepID=A0A2S1T243_9ACTN|nr:sigma-70 family RNA polymerase sigma factor [Streptomyces tirandamycinicus]AWI32720.1 hypothetical protein DDW44_30880 [Streptomyces tirandamycinicus]
MSHEAPRAQDEWASFEEFFGATYSRFLRRAMRRFRLSQQDAEDVLQQAYTETSMKEWADIESPEGYFWDKALKRFLDFNRKRASRRESLCDPAERFGEWPASATSSPDNCVALAHLRDQIRSLPENDQRLLMMKAAGYEKRQQAEEFGITEGNRRVRLARARAKLSKLRDSDVEGQK